MNLTKITSWVLYVLMAVSVVIAVLFYTGGTSEIDAPVNPHVNTTLYWGYVLVIIALGATLLLSIFNFIRNLSHDPKGAVKSIVPIVGLALVIVISWAIGDGSELYMPNYKGPDNTYTWLKFADMLFYTMYFLFGVAIVSVVVSSVIKIFR